MLKNGCILRLSEKYQIIGTFLTKGILIVYLLCTLLGCSNPEKQQTHDSVESDSFTLYDVSIAQNDTLARYLSRFNLDDCRSLNLFLTTMYEQDQFYRDSLVFYLRRDKSRATHFTKKVKGVDEINAKLLRTTMPKILGKLSCLDEESFQTLWIVPHHSKEKDLIISVEAAVDYGVSKGMILEDASALYYKNFDWVNR